MGMLTTAAGPREIKYLFVDGASLSCLLEDISKRYFDGVSIELDYNQLGNSFTKIFYYDAIPVKNPDELESEYVKRIAGKEKQLRHIRSFDRYHVYEGDARRRKGRGLEQKKVDVQITVDMLVMGSITLHQVQSYALLSWCYLTPLFQTQVNFTPNNIRPQFAKITYLLKYNDLPAALLPMRTRKR